MSMGKLNYRLMLYTCRVKCHDGVTRVFEQTGYFTNTDVLQHRLVDWNGQTGPAGEPYQYFETRAQAAHNDAACPIPFDLLPIWQCLWYGNCQHQCELKER
jgi:hypothetical protein